MDEMNGWKKLEEFVKENKKLLDPDLTVADITNGDRDMLMDLAGIVCEIKEMKLAYALVKLKGGYSFPLWNESIKMEIMRNVLIAEEQCKKGDGRRITQNMLRLAYETVYEYTERLTEFGVDQQAQITKVIDSLHKHIVRSRRRC